MQPNRHVPDQPIVLVENSHPVIVCHRTGSIPPDRG
jgi:hypothetical protein